MRSSKGDYGVVQTLKNPEMSRDSVTCLRYRPRSADADAANNVLLAACPRSVRVRVVTGRRCDRGRQAVARHVRQVFEHLQEFALPLQTRL